MGELVRMPHTQIISPTEDIDPLHPQAQVLMVIHGDVHMTMAAPGDTPSPQAELDIKIEAAEEPEPEPFRRKDRRPEVAPEINWTWRGWLRRGQHRKGSRA